MLIWLVGCWSLQRTGYIIGEKVIRHFEDRLRSRVRAASLALVPGSLLSLAGDEATTGNVSVILKYYYVNVPILRKLCLSKGYPYWETSTKELDSSCQEEKVASPTETGMHFGKSYSNTNTCMLQLPPVWCVEGGDGWGPSWGGLWSAQDWEPAVQRALWGEEPRTAQTEVQCRQYHTGAEQFQGEFWRWSGCWEFVYIQVYPHVEEAACSECGVGESGWRDATAERTSGQDRSWGKDCDQGLCALGDTVVKPTCGCVQCGFHPSRRKRVLKNSTWRPGENWRTIKCLM